MGSLRDPSITKSLSRLQPPAWKSRLCRDPKWGKKVFGLDIDTEDIPKVEKEENAFDLVWGKRVLSHPPWNPAGWGRIPLDHACGSRRTHQLDSEAPSGGHPSLHNAWLPPRTFPPLVLGYVHHEHVVDRCLLLHHGLDDNCHRWACVIMLSVLLIVLNGFR